MRTRTHKLKTHPQYFEEVFNGNKCFEIRKNDRDFKVGDFLLLEEYEPDKKQYTGRRMLVTVTYMTDYEQKEGFVVMSII